MSILLDYEVFALRGGESIEFSETRPESGRVLAVMARSVEMPDGPKSKVRHCDGEPVESAAILACGVTDSGEWHWLQLAPLSKEFVGDAMYGHGLEKDRWYYMAVRTLAILSLLLLTGSSGWAQEQKVVITRLRSDGVAIDFKTASADPLVRENVIRTAIAQNQPGDKFTVVAGEFQFTAPLSLNGVAIAGAGPDATFFRNNGIHSDKVGGAFPIGTTVLEGICFGSKSDPDYEDDRCLSLDGIPKGATVNTVIRNCRVYAGAWADYGWNGEAVWNLTLEDTEIYSGGQCLTGQGSGQDNNQNFTVRNCLFDVDPARCKCSSNQTIRNPVYGGSLAIALRGGTHVFENVKIIARGGAGIANVAGITDTYENGPRDTLKLTVNNLDCQVIPNGTALANCWDVRLQNDKVRAAAKFSGKLVGSGEFDSLRQWVPGTGGVK